MSRIIFLNGQYVPAAEATVSVMDRGFTFADGIYEVTAVARGKLVDNDAHLARLTRSLSEIGIDNPYTAAEWTRVCEELVARNGLDEGVVYMQVTRGVAERDFGIPADITPTAVAFTQVKSIVNSPLAKKGAAVVTVPDLRWKRCDIKSVGLLPQVMAKQIAARAGAHEAWMTDGDRVTEGASSTAFIITADKRLITRPLSNAVLPGITRVSILALARKHGLTLEERTFTVAEAQQAAEVFYTSASTFVMPVVSIDGVQIGNGQPGPLTQALRTLYLRFAGVDVAEPVGQM
ncbi:D-amino-acid transaminase [Ralstonia mojiangensis]|uniref:branched-chain-amino-acid transaminase n=1 Tax=Ralstonia mojiangensis TaxID=2953895 RepID=A0AAE3I4Z2_9RALS|nr:D-amino-acid transaminase [Ralstonia mojiangensis]MCO5413392.1 D-amino-acid transaminase [Ralstonia mojiangensis]MCT7317262.1 D-amino-acid transaminase [Ralstonia mojiangensis]MCT7328912.1 D-amino-acid transaminase [Ralstonia mojiangensis]